MARKGETIYKRKDGRWEARFIKSYQSGKAVYGYVYGKTYSEVKRKCSEVMKDIKKSEKNTILSDQPNLRQVSSMWLSSLQSTRKASTIIKYSNQLDKHILPAFGDRCLSEITNEAMIDFGNQLLIGNNALSTKSASDIISHIKSIRKYALIHGYEVGFVPECITSSQTQGSIRLLLYRGRTFSFSLFERPSRPYQLRYTDLPVYREQDWRIMCSHMEQHLIGYKEAPSAQSLYRTTS